MNTKASLSEISETVTSTVDNILSEKLLSKKLKKVIDSQNRSNTVVRKETINRVEIDQKSKIELYDRMDDIVDKIVEFENFMKVSK